jgi:hypothetical protein
MDLGHLQSSIKNIHLTKISQLTIKRWKRGCLYEVVLFEKPLESIRYSLSLQSVSRREWHDDSKGSLHKNENNAVMIGRAEAFS